MTHFYQAEYSKSNEMSLLKLGYKKTPSILLISLIPSTDWSDENQLPCGELSYGKAHTGKKIKKNKKFLTNNQQLN